MILKVYKFTCWLNNSVLNLRSVTIPGLRHRALWIKIEPSRFIVPAENVWLHNIYFLDCVFFSSDFVFCDSFCCVISGLPDLNMMMVAICLSSFFFTLSSHVLIFCFTFRDCSSTVVYAKAVELFLLLKNGVYTTFL